MENKHKNNGHVSLDFAFLEEAKTATLTPKQIVKPEAKTGVIPQAKDKKEKKEIPPQIDDVEKVLRCNGKGLYFWWEKKDGDGKPITTPTGKTSKQIRPLRIGRLWVERKDGSFYLNFFVKPKQQIPLQSVQISEQEYNQFLSTASLKKRINILRNHVDGEVFIRKFKKDKGVFFRLGEEDCNLLKELTAKTGLSESDVIISRLWGTILHEALTPEEKANQKKLLGLADEMKQFAVALANYLKTTGAKGAQRLDFIFNSQPGADYAKAIFEAAEIIKKSIKNNNNDN